MPSLELFTVQHQRALPFALREWLDAGRVSPLDRPWIVVPSAAMRQRVDWDLADAQEFNESIASNMRYLFPEEFVSTIESMVLGAMGRERHDWRVEAIAGRLASLAMEPMTWSEVLAEASLLDEVVRWRPESLESRSFAPTTTLLLATDEWREHGPLVQRATTLRGLADGAGHVPNSIALYGLANAPGGQSFVALVAALAQRSRVAVFFDSPMPEEEAPIGWVRSVREHHALWQTAGATVILKESSPASGDVRRLQGILDNAESEALASDGSVQLLGAVGLARQVEMSRDVILRVLEEGRAAPHEILLTAPDIDPVLAHVERFWGFEKFDEAGRRLPRVPFEVIERPSASFRSRDRLASLLLSCIGGYVTPAVVDELLAYPAVCQALKIDEVHRGRLLTLAREGRVSFGTSSQQRESLAVFPSHSEVGTWDRLLARLAMTAMRPDDNDDPDQLGTGDDLVALGSVRRLFDAIEGAQSSLVVGERRSLDEWVTWLQEQFKSFLKRGASKDSSLERTLQQVASDFPVNAQARVDFEFFRSYWQSLSESGSRGQTFGRYGVHVAPLTALAAASYKYVAVVGVDEEGFPSAQLQSPTLTSPKLGDPNPRAAMLGALYTVLRGATDGICIAFNDRNEMSGEEAKYSIVLEELVGRIGGKSSPLIRRGSRHGFAIPLDRPVVSETFDPRYEGIADRIISASRRPSLVVARQERAKDAAVETSAPDVVSVKQLQRFVRNSIEHFVEKGMLGSVLERIATDEVVPRTGIDDLATYNLRLEIVNKIIGDAFDENGTTADEAYFDILGRESVGADIPLLMSELRQDKLLQKAALDYRNDLDCYDPLSDDDTKRYYAPVSLTDGTFLEVRSSAPDEWNPWTVVRDFSPRQVEHPGAPAVLRLYPNKVEGEKELRETLTMLVDLLVMKVQQPAHETGSPVATIFIAKAGKQGSIPQLSYRYHGTAEEARDSLEELVRLYRRGLSEPLAIGRYTTPLTIEGGMASKGFSQDRKEPLFAPFFGATAREFLSHSEDQGVHQVFETIANRVEKQRETATKRTSGRGHTEPTTYYPMIDFVKHAKNGDENG